MPGQNLRLDLSDAPVELIELPDENAEDRLAGLRDRALVVDAGTQTTRLMCQMPCGSMIPNSAK